MTGRTTRTGPTGDQRVPTGGPGSGSRFRWLRVLAGALVVLVAGGILVGGAAALVARLGADGAATSQDESGQSGSGSEDGAGVPAVTDFESFARGIDGVSDDDDAVVVELVPGSESDTPRGTADVLLDADGEGAIAAVAAALTGWASDAEAAGAIVLDVRLTTAGGAVDLSRPASANAERLAVAGEVVADPDLAAFWIGASRVDLVLAAGADQPERLAWWTARVGEIAPSMSVTVRTADAT